MRRFAQALVMAAAAFALLIGTVLIPRMQNAPVYSASYVDVLASDQAIEMAYTEAPPAR